jgi:hypothetical protein
MLLLVYCADSNIVEMSSFRVWLDDFISVLDMDIPLPILHQLWSLIPHIPLHGVDAFSLSAMPSTCSLATLGTTGCALKLTHTASSTSFQVSLCVYMCESRDGVVVCVRVSVCVSGQETNEMR